MKKLILFLSGCLAGAPVFGQLSVGNPEYEPFANATNAGGTSYTAGATLAGQTSASYAAYNPGGQAWWEYGPSIAGGSVASHQPTIAAGDLSVSNLLSVGGGQSAAFGGNGDSALMNLTTDANGMVIPATVYFSYALKLTNISNLDTNGTFITGFCNLQSHDHGINTPASIGARVMVRSDGAGGFNIGFAQGGNNNPSGFNIAWDDRSFTTSDTLFLVGSYTLQGVFKGTDDYANFWVNPDASTFGADSAPTNSLMSSGSSIDLARIASFVILDHADNEPGGVIDDLRIGLDWADVTPSSNSVEIVQNPVSQTLPQGYNATFSVTADGAPPLTYQWIKNGSTVLTDGGNISGAHSNVLTVANISAADAGDYAVYVTNGFGKFVFSDSATLSLSDPSITNQPQSLTNDYGTTATFVVGPAGTAPFTYQWQKDGVDLSDGGNISGSHSNVLTVTNLAYPDGGNYSVTITNALGATVQSLAATLTVNDPAIVTQPLSVADGAGATATFHVEADGSPTLLYQWFLNGSTFLFDGGNISGAQTATLSISDISSSDEGHYSVLVQGAYGSVTSSVASLTVLTPVTMAAPPNPRTVAAGDNAVFAVGPGGTGPFYYQWLRDGTNLPGATSHAYTVTNAQPSDMANFSVIVSNAFSAATSAPVALTVSNSLSLAEGNLVVIRVGDGAQTLTVDGNSMFLDQYTTNGQYINSVAIPDTGPSAMTAIGWDNINGVNSGSTTGSCLSRSLDGRFLVIAGYNTNLSYGASLAGSHAADVPRGIGWINSHAQYRLAAADTNAFDRTYWRAAITDGTNNFWGDGGNTGTYYFGYDAPAAVVQSLFNNSRSMELFNGDIYCAEASNPRGILKISGMPANATTATNYLFAGTTGTFDLAVSPDGNLIYVSDQSTINTGDPNSGGGVQRWEFDTNSSTWSLAYTLIDGYGTIGPRYIAVDFSGPNPVIYVTSNDGTFDNNRIVRTVDTGPSSVGATLAYAGANETFRGIRFGPVASAAFVTRPTLSFAREGSNLILDWSGSFTLQSATNAAGPYQDVSGASSPYTNSLTGAGQMFFRLRN